MSWIEGAKREAAGKAVALVESGSVIGLGSGSTASYATMILGKRLMDGELEDVFGVPTSLQAAAEAVEAGVPLTTLDEHPVLNLGIDGADQIDHDLNAIKGGGGALLREKVVASASRRFIVIADGRKLTGRLGEGCSLPVEVLPFALGSVQRKLIDLGAEVSLRCGSGKLGPVLTDNGNLILDADFGIIPEPRRLERELKAIPGIIETGLFLGFIDLAFIGTKEGMKRLDKKNKEEI